MIPEVLDGAREAPIRPAPTAAGSAYDLLAGGNPSAGGQAGPFPGIPARVHLLGAGGAGVSGAGILLLARSHRITGHDRTDSRFVAALRNRGACIDIGPSRAELLPADAELIARSAAVPEDDPQVREALRCGLPVVKYSQLLTRIAPPRRTLAVAGTHGKTTTSWMLYWALRGIAAADRERDSSRREPARAPHGAFPGALPGALIGGACRTLGASAVAFEDGGWFACEACEYDRSFLQLEPDGAIVTNVEADHLDYYGSLDAIEEAFARFVDRVHPEGLVVVGRDVPESIVAASPCPVWRLSREIDVDRVQESHGHYRFRLRGPGWATGEIALSVPGAFNVDNAALALALAIGRAGGEETSERARALEAAARAVGGYCGAERRFEPWGTAGGVEVVHDYAHHPTEVRVTIEAARRALPGKPLHVLFQPHQHSRTARFMDEFVESLRGADRVVVADVYGARAHIDTRAAGAEELVARLRRAGVDAVCGGPPVPSAKILCAGLCGQSAALILGAGDIDLVQHELLEELALRGPGRRRPVQ
jgi:UDP-N-acetylmuramate--alanine ligase